MRLGRLLEARDSYEKALAPARQEPERGFLAGRLREIEIKTGSAFDFFCALRRPLGLHKSGISIHSWMAPKARSYCHLDL